MNITEFVHKKNEDNHLGLNEAEVVLEIKKLKTLFNDISEYELFYTVLLNMFGHILNTIDTKEPHAEMLGWLKVKKRNYGNNNIIYYYRFETEDDYYYWLSIRKKIYSKLSNYSEIRLFNYIELSTFDFITDSLNNGTYKVYNNNEKVTIKKQGILTSSGNKFIKELVSYYNKKFIFKPI